MDKNNRHSTCEVLVAVAVSERGDTACCICNSNRLPEQRKYEAWIADKREGKVLWTVKVVRVKVPTPMSFEDGEIYASIL